MKDIKRLAAAADFHNHPDQYLVLQLVDHDGGPFELVPKYEDGILYIPSIDAPAYRVAITADNPETLERFAKALLTVVRAQRGGEA